MTKRKKQMSPSVYRGLRAMRSQLDVFFDTSGDHREALLWIDDRIKAFEAKHEVKK